MNRGALYYFMIPLLLVAALIQSTTLARLKLLGVKPDLVLLLVVVGALLYGARPALLWAFVGGLALDIFSGGPLGASSIALMATALVAGVGHRPLYRFNLLVPVVAAMAGTLAYGLVYLAIVAGLNTMGLFAHQLPLVETMRYIVLPETLYNTVLMLLFVPLLNRMPESQDI